MQGTYIKIMVWIIHLAVLFNQVQVISPMINQFLYKSGIENTYKMKQPIPVATPSKACVCGHLLAGILVSNSKGGMDVCLLWMLFVVR
jgi:hypothetical protein